jgi:GNAT superfamily N-acetyltransferase
MTIDVSRVPLDEIRALRELRRREMNCQIILYSWPERGWADSFLLRRADGVVGYASVGGREERDLVTEFYIVPAERASAQRLFRRLIEVSGAKNIECQSNDRLLTLMLYDFAAAIESHVVLFEDGMTTHLPPPGPLTLRRAAAADKERIARDDGDVDAAWLLEAEDGSIVATGGLLFHYNVPYGDLYMRVGERFRRRGYGSYLIQELKRVAYEMGKVPAARCNAVNVASRATLQKAGMMPCGRMLAGAITNPRQREAEPP